MTAASVTGSARKPAAKPAKPAADPKFTAPTNPSDIRLGMEVFDRASKLRGLVITRADMFNGNTQFAIMAQGDGSEIKEGTFVDWHAIGIIGKGISDILPPVATDVKVGLGEKVKDRVSGLQGMVIERITFQNGCVYLNVQPPVDKKKPDAGMPKAVLFDHMRLIGIDKGISHEMPAAISRPDIAAPKPKSTGGPMRRMADFNRA